MAPDTYFFVRGEDRSALLSRMRRAQDRILEVLWSGRVTGLPFDTPRKALILASIIEKETAVSEERNRVASVFVNRLRKGMRLQSDPTVIFGLTAGSGPLERRLTRSDLDSNSPFNTYRSPRTSAGADLQSWPGLHRGRAAAGGNGVSLLRRRTGAAGTLSPRH